MEAIPKENPVDDDAAMGDIESDVREIQKGVRALKLDLERELHRKLQDEDPVLSRRLVLTRSID